MIRSILCYFGFHAGEFHVHRVHSYSDKYMKCRICPNCKTSETVYL